LLISVQPLEIQLSSEEGWEKTLTKPKGQSESYIEDEHTTQWPKEKSTKGQTTIYNDLQNIHIKLKIE
jgi:hypothetical protein